jgi:hypothetical protein
MIERETQSPRLILKKMPSQEMLEEFINRLNGSERRQVHFNIINGEFEWDDERREPVRPQE